MMAVHSFQCIYVLVLQRSMAALGTMERNAGVCVVRGVAGVHSFVVLMDFVVEKVGQMTDATKRQEVKFTTPAFKKKVSK